MTPMQMLDDKAVAVHVRGKSGPGYERPWASAAAGNPLGAWAERMQEQQQQPQPAAAKKKN
jgi:N-acetyl-anhydromuramyl-L-alanine amidase AmpD